MIDRHQLGRACSANDRESERGKPLSDVLEFHGFKTGDTTHVALQRALRCWSVLVGEKDASKLTPDDLINMSEKDRMTINALAASWIDGLVVASRALDAEGR